MRERNQMTKKVFIPWAFCQRKPRVSVGSGITSDAVIISEGFPSFYEIKLRNNV